MSNANNTNFALIKWVEESAFEVVSQKRIKDKPPQLVLEKEYMVQWRGDYYLAVLLWIGTKVECSGKLSEIQNYEQDGSLRAQVNKPPSDPIDPKDLKIKILEDELCIAKAKITELELSQKSSQSTINECTNKIKRKDDEIKELKDQIGKILIILNFILKTF